MEALSNVMLLRSTTNNSTKEMIDLKWLNPCPTCGRKDEINSGQTSPGRYFVRCNRCRVEVSDDREQKVQAEWNEIGYRLRARVKELEDAISEGHKSVVCDAGERIMRIIDAKVVSK